MGEWIRQKSKVRHSQRQSRWGDYLPLIALGLFGTAALIYLIYSFVTAPVPNGPHPVTPATPAAVPATNQSPANVK